MPTSDYPKPKKTAIRAFLKKLWKFHAENRRDLPWRRTKDPYKILLSELMLQQTQVPRVLQKYAEFLIKFPTLQDVQRASIADVLTVWKGLGYNRRAYFIKKIADILANANFKFPRIYEELIKLPGIGQSTGGALVAFCFAEKTGQKIPFIETNVRLVLIHEFFSDFGNIHDAELVTLLKQCLDETEPANIREFYYALYDYGTYLKSILGKRRTELHKKSKHYAKQSAFKGSIREMRSWILGIILSEKKISKQKLYEIIIKKYLAISDSPQNHLSQKKEYPRFESALSRLLKDGSIKENPSIATGSTPASRTTTAKSQPIYSLL